MNENLNNNLPENDDYVIGKGFEVEELVIESQKPKKKHKQTRNITKTVITVVLIFTISIGLAFGIIYAGADFVGIGFGRGQDVTIEIESGSSATKIADQLNDCGAVKIPILFRLFAKFKGYESQFKYGVYNFNTESGYKSIANMLITQGAKAESVTVTIPEGTGINDFTKNVNGENVTVSGIATLLENAGVCTKSDFLSAMNEVKLEGKLLSNADPDKTYYTLEGYLFPETYEFYNYDSKECAVLDLLRLFFF